MKKPFAILLGGQHPKATLELHDICFTMAEDKEQAFKQVAHRWFGDLKTAHVDCWLDLTTVDGHRLVPIGESEPRKTLFFINTGYYEKSLFNEMHRYAFLIGEDEAQVKDRARIRESSHIVLPHVDNLENVEQIIPLPEIEGLYLGWKKDVLAVQQEAHTGYWPLAEYQ